MKIVDTKRRASRPAFTDGVRVNRTGRRTYTPDYKSELVRQCRGPGVSVAAIALAHGINANLVRRWIVAYQRRLMNPADPAPKVQATLLPVTIDAATASVDGRADGAVTKRTRPDMASIEIELYGARIHLRGGVDEQALRSVLAVLAQR